MVKKAHVVAETIEESRGIKTVITDHKTYTIYENIRKEAGDFSAYYFCSICDLDHNKFHPKLLRLPGSDLLACRSCVCNMEEALKAAQLYDCGKGRKE